MISGICIIYLHSQGSWAICFLKTLTNIFSGLIKGLPDMAHEPRETEYIIHIPENMFKLFPF